MVSAGVDDDNGSVSEGEEEEPSSVLRLRGIIRRLGLVVGKTLNGEDVDERPLWLGGVAIEAAVEGSAEV